MPVHSLLSCSNQAKVGVVAQIKQKRTIKLSEYYCVGVYPTDRKIFSLAEFPT